MKYVFIIYRALNLVRRLPGVNHHQVNADEFDRKSSRARPSIKTIPIIQTTVALLRPLSRHALKMSLLW
jgi:hypothetical protein